MGSRIKPEVLNLGKGQLGRSERTRGVKTGREKAEHFVHTLCDLKNVYTQTHGIFLEEIGSFVMLTFKGENGITRVRSKRLFNLIPC